MSIGSEFSPLSPFYGRRPARGREAGFTFFEILGALAVLSVGVVMINKALLLSLDFQDGMIQRVYIQNLLSHELAVLQREYAALGPDMPLRTENRYAAQVNHKQLVFDLISEMTEPAEPQGLRRAWVTVAWSLRGRTLTARREGLLLTFVRDDAAEGQP